jgi:Reverse transcriptase (RNA-dependent DNA polymerase)
LHSTFSLKDLEDLHYFLGIEVTSVDSGIYLTQTRYLHSILDRAAMAGAKPCKTPMQPGLKLSKSDGTVLSDPHLYRAIVGTLQYATITRPDLAFSVNKVSQFVANPTDVHWQTVKRILRYVKGTIHHGLHLRSSSHLCLNGYSDADWAGCPDDRRSTTGYAVFFGSNIVSWSSKK